eukprot:SM000238S08038  [mRNA]  locus=s238:669:5101:+ [translate_table: standard]
MTKKQQRGKAGNVVNYTTRNQALNRLQLKLPEFRRLCILKGVFPREPRKKVHGHNKTYYHVKDINFLLHEPILEKSRPVLCPSSWVVCGSSVKPRLLSDTIIEIRAHERKIKKAKAKQSGRTTARLEANCPQYTLDHLVKERYPSFIDALRDLDDPLSLIHLFAVLPADASHKIPAKRVHGARSSGFVCDARVLDMSGLIAPAPAAFDFGRLALEWQAYITRTHSLRKVFVSVKGIYYQADVIGQKVTWLVPHAMSQILPSDVDFRVMLTFLEFYETLMGFVNFKLYHSLGLKYPPVLDPRLEAAAADLFSAMKSLVKADQTADEEVYDGDGKKDNEREGQGVPEVDQGPTILGGTEAEREVLQAESAVRLASFQVRLKAMEAVGQAASRQTESRQTEDLGAIEQAEQAEEQDGDDDEETVLARRVFQGFVFFLAREVPRESLLLVIRAFGGIASWDGDGAPFQEADESITHQVVDRPTQGHRFLSRDYVQPQWIFDSANACIALPTNDHGPGLVPPPHLSPFVDNEAEGYVPEYAEVIHRLKDASSKGPVLSISGIEAEADLESKAAVAARSEEAAAASQLQEVQALERQYADDLAKEVAGVPFSASLAEVANDTLGLVGAGASEAEDEAVADVDSRTDMEGQRDGSLRAQATEADDEAAMAQIMMPRKTKQLYDAMQMGRAKKRAGVALLEERKRKALAKKAKP